MKINSQDSQFDAAFDAKCREMLAKRSVDAPPMADSTLSEPRKGRKLARMAGAIVLMGLGFVFWNEGEGNVVSDAEVTAPASIVEPTTESPAVAAEAASIEAPTVTPNQENVQGGTGSVQEHEPKTDMAEGLNFGLTDRPDAHAVESVQLVPAPSKALPPVTELQEESISNPLESVGLETSAPSASSTPEEVGNAMDNAVEPAAEHPSENTEPSSAPEGGEPVLRLPLTLPSGGGR